jgi:hypothetical protein
MPGSGAVSPGAVSTDWWPQSSVSLHLFPEEKEWKEQGRSTAGSLSSWAPRQRLPEARDITFMALAVAFKNLAYFFVHLFIVCLYSWNSRSTLPALLTIILQNSGRKQNPMVVSQDNQPPGATSLLPVIQANTQVLLWGNSDDVIEIPDELP